MALGWGNLVVCGRPPGNGLSALPAFKHQLPPENPKGGEQEPFDGSAVVALPPQPVRAASNDVTSYRRSWRRRPAGLPQAGPRRQPAGPGGNRGRPARETPPARGRATAPGAIRARPGGNRGRPGRERRGPPGDGRPPEPPPHASGTARARLPGNGAA